MKQLIKILLYVSSIGIVAILFIFKGLCKLLKIDYNDTIKTK